MEFLSSRRRRRGSGQPYLMTKPKPEKAREGAPLPIPDLDLPPWTSICHQLPSPPANPPFTIFPFAQWPHNGRTVAIHPQIRRCSTLFGGATRGSRPLHQHNVGMPTAPQCPDQDWRRIARSVTRAIGQISGSPSCHLAPFVASWVSWWGRVLTLFQLQESHRGRWRL